MAPSPARSPVGLWVIGVYKLVKALGAIALGSVVFRLSPDDLAGRLIRVAARLRLDPEDRLIHQAIARLSGLDRRQLEAIGAGIVVYGLLYLTEGIGLILQRRWAENLVVASTSLLIPFETYEVLEKPGPVRVAVLAANILVVAYLIVRLRRERADRREALAARGPGLGRVDAGPGD